MKYVYIGENLLVGSIISEEDPVFPGIPVEQRFSNDFLRKCIAVEDSVADAIEVGSMYDPDSNIFYVPEPPAIPDPPSVEENPDQPVDPDVSEEHKTYAEKLNDLSNENKQLNAKLQAAIESNQMLEECLVEMAEIVYA